ncbi:hypothetical protein H6A12_09535 [Phocea massiliensis]|uniref:Uncharacterized protein n=1 Tax=Merdimmobilis hominis TaxID=2897707 RepID=A0A938X8X3_9FIRM|nr:hypothetical protein [Merdimmobilis hominis]MBM6921396.1 hypothetical protein [Merdimmobilis hominis]
MPKLDLYSFHCGIIDCFCEMVAAGLKPLALSEPLPSKEDCEEYLPFVEECAKKHRISFYLELDSLVTDLFPFEKNKNKSHFLFYRDPQVLARYKEIRQEKERYLTANTYDKDARFAIASAFGALLGYPSDGINRLIAQNERPEP